MDEPDRHQDRNDHEFDEERARVASRPAVQRLLVFEVGLHDGRLWCAMQLTQVCGGHRQRTDRLHVGCFNVYCILCS